MNTLLSSTEHLLHYHQRPNNTQQIQTSVTAALFESSTPVGLQNSSLHKEWATSWKNGNLWFFCWDERERSEHV